MATTLQNKPMRTITELCRITDSATNRTHELTTYRCGSMEVHVTEFLAPKKLSNKKKSYKKNIASYVGELWTLIEGSKDNILYCALDRSLLSSLLLCSVSHALLKQYDVLVGIEPNPGPAITILQLLRNTDAVKVNIGRENPVVAIQFRDTKSLLDAFPCYTDYFRKTSLDENEYLLDVPKSRLIFGYFVSSQFLKEYDLLVGVEPNPGPKKNQHARVPTFKRVVINSQVRAMKREERKFTKELNNNIHAKEALKKLFEPEGLFDLHFGVDQESKEFIKALSDQFAEASKSMKIEHDLNLGFSDWIRGIIDWLFTIPSHLYKFFIGMIDIICMALPKGLASAIRTILAITGHEISEDGDFQPESSVPIDSIFTAMYSGELAKHIHKGSWSGFVSSIKAIKANSFGAVSVFDFLIKILREVAIFLNDVFNLNLPVLGDSTDVAEFSTKAKKLADELRVKGSVDDAFADKAFLLKDDIEAYLMAKGSRLESHLKERLNYILKGFQSVIVQCERCYSPMRGTRVEPLGILIAGGTGAGKSTLTMPFLLALMANVLEGDQLASFKKSHNDLIFYRHTENEYWDGYRQKDVAIVYDDFGQQTDVAGSPCLDAFEIIRGINTAPWHLHYSAVEDKSKHYANFKLLYATTNRTSLFFESIFNSKAVIRRFHIRVFQVPKPEFCVDGTSCSFETRELDIDKVRSRFPLDFDKPESYAALGVVEFVEWDFYHGRAKRDPKIYSFDALLIEAIRLYTANIKKGDHMVAFHELMKDYVPGETRLVPEMGITEDLAKLDAGRDEPPLIPLESSNGIEKQQLYDVILQWFDKVAVLKNKYVPSTYEWCVDSLPGIVRFAKFLLITVTGIKAFKLAYKWWFPGLEPQYGKGGSASNRRRARIRAAKTVRNTLGVEAFVPGPANDLSLSLFARSIYAIEFAGRRLGYATFVKGTSFFMPLHFYDHISDTIAESDDDQVRRLKFLHPNSGHVCFVLDWNTDFESEYLLDEKMDFVIMKVHESKIRKHKDIIKFFPKHMDDSFIHGENYTCSMSTFDIPSARWRDHSFGLRINGNVPYELAGTQYTSRALEYNCNTNRGDCGLPLIVSDTRLKMPLIMGYHTAGDLSSWGPSKNCVGVMVFQEELTDFCDLNTEEFDEDIDVDYVPEGNVFDGFPAVSKARKVPMPKATKIQLSDLSYHLDPPETAPAVLRPVMRGGVLIDPMSKARKNYQHDEVFIDQDVVDVVYPYVTRLITIQTRVEPHKTRIFTFEEAVSGVDGLDYFDGIKRSTSAGYPYIFETGGKKGKTKWFGSDGTADLTTSESKYVQRKVEHIINSARRGIRLKHVFVDHLKDETRPLAKIESVSTRQIMTCPMDYLIAIKMYFGDFMRHVLENRIFNGMAPGIDPFTEWGTLVGYLQSGHTDKDVEFVAGDYSKYDGKIPVPIARTVLRIIQDWYGSSSKEDNLIRDVLFHEIHNSMHTTDGVIYEFVGGNPSGQPLTTIFNSMANIVMQSYATACDAKSRGLLNVWYKSFFGLRISVFGDDVILTNSRDEHGLWTQRALEHSIFVYLGIVYTDDTKDGGDRGARSITDVTFLKRSFRYFGGVWHCPLNLGVILDTLKWNKKDTSAAEMDERIRNVFVELSRHGKDVFDIHAASVRHAAVRCGYLLPPENAYAVALDSVEGLDY